MMRLLFMLLNLCELLGAAAGLLGGGVLGAAAWGWPGGVLGALAGGLAGRLLGRVPYTLALQILHWNLRRCDTATLQRRLARDYFISHFIIAYLVLRGIPAETLLPPVLDQLRAPNPGPRRFGWKNLRMWFPETAQKLPDFNPDEPTAVCQKKLAALEEG
jgi:hypothetical protein